MSRESIMSRWLKLCSIMYFQFLFPCIILKFRSNLPFRKSLLGFDLLRCFRFWCCKDRVQKRSLLYKIIKKNYNFLQNMPKSYNFSRF